MTEEKLLQRLYQLDTNTISDALDFLELKGATFGLRPLWNCPKIVGIATTIQLGPKTDPRATLHPITPVIAETNSANRILVITGGLEGISSWGDLVANASQLKGIKGTILDGVSRDIEGSESIGYPVFGRGVTMISARNRVAQISSYEPIQVQGVTVSQDDYVIADRCGTVFIPVGRIEEVIALGEKIAARQDGMVQAIRAGRSVSEVMHDKEFAAIVLEKQK
jgi:4-hydroxy-4-methyl-2-oxoglutarate aldolase